MNQKPPCPRCQKTNNVTVGAGKPGERLMYCSGCRAMFDDDPDEGSDYSDRDPAARMIREEERKRKRA